MTNAPQHDFIGDESPTEDHSEPALNSAEQEHGFIKPMDDPQINYGHPLGSTAKPTEDDIAIVDSFTSARRRNMLTPWQVIVTATELRSRRDRGFTWGIGGGDQQPGETAEHYIERTAPVLGFLSPNHLSSLHEEIGAIQEDEAHQAQQAEAAVARDEDDSEPLYDHTLDGQFDLGETEPTVENLSQFAIMGTDTPEGTHWDAGRLVIDDPEVTLRSLHLVPSMPQTVQLTREAVEQLQQGISENITHVTVNNPEPHGSAERIEKMLRKAAKRKGLTLPIKTTTGHEDNTPVNHPVHYNADPSGVECIEIIRHRTHNVGAAIKYLWRAGLKADSQSDVEAKQIEDLNKAIWYLRDEVTRLGGTPA